MFNPNTCRAEVDESLNLDSDASLVHKSEFQDSQDYTEKPYPTTTTTTTTTTTS